MPNTPWFQPQPLPWQPGGGQGLNPNPWTGEVQQNWTMMGQPNSGMPLPNMGPAPTWGVGPQPDQPAWPGALGGAPNWQGMPNGMQQGQDDDPIAQILEVTSTTPPEHAPDFISFMRQQDPHDVGMALALFQQSFTDPQGALQWAFQLKQSRDAQRARMEQKQVETQAKQDALQEKQKFEREKSLWTKRQLRINQITRAARDAGVMDDLASEFGVPPEEWGDEHIQVAEDRIAQSNKAIEGRDSADKLRAQVAKGLRNPDNAYLEWKTKYGEDEGLKADLTTIKTDFVKAKADKQAFLNLTKQEKIARTKLYNKLSDEQKGASKELENDIELVETEVKQIDEKLTDYEKLIVEAQSSGLTLKDTIALLKQRREELLGERKKLQGTKVDVLGGRKDPTSVYPSESKTGGEPSELSPEDEQEFTARWLSNSDPAFRERLKAAMKAAYPNLDIEAYIPAE